MAKKWLYPALRASVSLYFKVLRINLTDLIKSSMKYTPGGFLVRAASRTTSLSLKKENLTIISLGLSLNCSVCLPGFGNRCARSIGIFFIQSLSIPSVEDNLSRTVDSHCSQVSLWSGSSTLQIITLFLLHSLSKLSNCFLISPFSWRSSATSAASVEAHYPVPVPDSSQYHQHKLLWLLSAHLFAIGCLLNSASCPRMVCSQWPVTSVHHYKMYHSRLT